MARIESTQPYNKVTVGDLKVSPIFIELMQDAVSSDSIHI